MKKQTELMIALGFILYLLHRNKVTQDALLEAQLKNKVEGIEEEGELETHIKFMV